jgi:two-component system, NtrC family, C4-dicarboxylate transport response regulator DctD
MTLVAQTPVVILVEDDEALRAATVQGLDLAGLVVRAFRGAEEALTAIVRDLDGVVVSDIRLPRMDGLELLTAVRARDAELPVILVTGHGDVPMAVGALKQGAFDFLTKPFAVDHLASTIRRALEHRSLVVENRRLRAAVAAAEDAGPLIGNSPAIVRLREAIHQLAEADVDVLVEGETGTGKDLVGTLLHRQSPRRSRPLISVDCAALPEALVEVELFGHASDSVPHTRLSRDGQIVLSDGGTLLLDAIDATSLPIQAKLLRVLEEREVLPLGAGRAHSLNLRVVATSSVDLASAVAAGVFRADLYHRLARTRLHLIPLRERTGDTLLLFAGFAHDAARQFGRPEMVMTDAVRAHLLSHAWPGNVRELRNYAWQLVLAQQEHSRTDELGSDRADLRSRVAEFEAAMISEALTRTRGNVVRALDLLGLPRKTLYDKLTRYGIDPQAFRTR